MIKIKLSRTGKKNQASFRVVIAEARSKNQGLFTATIGFYNPLQKNFKINFAQYQDWLSKGAQPTATVLKLVKKHCGKTS